jgi:pimeloyl-ACP methyl ester carboxylesterase
MSRDIAGPQGRTLRIYEGGEPGGPLIVVHHGTPAGGALFEPWVRDARERGAHLVSYDRPGYGGSTPDPDRLIAAAAADAAAIADAVGAERFATWGISGGGPHALACAALLPERVAGAATLAGVAPFDAEGLNPMLGMGEENVVDFGAALIGREAVEPRALEQVQELLRAKPADLVELMSTLMSPVDAERLRGPFGEYWSGLFPDVFAQSAAGWVDDDLAFVRPWGFDVEDIRVPVLLWHGRHDRFVPIGHAEWLYGRIPECEARLTLDDGHLTLVADRVPAVHEWLLARF